MNTRAMAVCAFALSLGAASQASAQHTLLVGIGLGQGSGWPACADCSGISHRQGLTGYLRVGAFVTPHVSLALEGDSWYNDASDANSRFASGMAVLQLYTAPASGLSLKLGAGIGNSLIEFSDPTLGSVTATGFAYTVGLAYDFPLSARLAVAPFADYLATAGAAEQYSLGPASGTLDGNVVRFGVGVTWR